MGQYDIDFVGC